MPTQKKSLEQDNLLRENARLRGDLLTIGSRISHDLRTPLGSILNTAELLKEILAEKNPSDAPLAESFFTSVDEMTKLIKSVSLLAKATAKPLPLEKVKMGEIISTVSQRLENRILKRRATVDVVDSWPEVNGVAEWLEFIWWNFVANALEHGGDAPKIQLGWQREKSEYKFWIRDSGAGISEVARAKLFQNFDSLHQPDSARGLSLSIIQRLVELQGGHCGHKGDSQFFFTLPL